MLLEYLPKDLHEGISSMDQTRLGKIMDLMKIRIHFFKDMNNHTYFFKDPVYSKDISKKFLTKLK